MLTYPIVDLWYEERVVAFLYFTVTDQVSPFAIVEKQISESAEASGYNPGSTKSGW
jgi:hypothetical protein